ncbi:MAG: hypothetical protein HYU64_21440 [Armatimonadetes bacterium]|nr:hypothetical protein [Armatimonadota bacterium]
MDRINSTQGALYARSLSQGPVDRPGSGERELTVLYYLNGQARDLQEQIAEGFLGIEQIPTGDRVAMVAQLARKNDYDLSAFKYSIEENAKENYERAKEAIFHIPVDGDWAGVRRYEIRHSPHDDAQIPSGKYLDLLDTMPKNPVLHYHIGKALWSEGSKDDAAYYFQRAEELGIRQVLQDEGSPKSRAFIRRFRKETRQLDESWFGKRNFASTPLETFEESPSMAEGKTLEDFISWGMRKFPAKHYVLVMEGHGGGWYGWGDGIEPMAPSEIARAVKSGVREASAASGQPMKMDAIIFNSCYMANMEAMESLRGSSDVTLASENFSNGGAVELINGYIAGVGRDIEEGKPFHAREFARGLVEESRKDQVLKNEKIPGLADKRAYFHTLSAIDNGKIGDLSDALARFVDHCKKSGVTYGRVIEKVKQARSYGYDGRNPAYFDLRDLGDLMEKIKDDAHFPEPVRSSAGEVIRGLSGAIIHEHHEVRGMEGSHGLTLWAPLTLTDEYHRHLVDTYRNNADEFLLRTGWLDFIEGK